MYIEVEYPLTRMLFCRVVGALRVFFVSSKKRYALALNIHYVIIPGSRLLAFARANPTTLTLKSKRRNFHLRVECSRGLGPQVSAQPVDNAAPVRDSPDSAKAISKAEARKTSSSDSGSRTACDVVFATLRRQAQPLPDGAFILVVSYTSIMVQLNQIFVVIYEKIMFYQTRLDFSARIALGDGTSTKASTFQLACILLTRWVTNHLNLLELSEERSRIHLRRLYHLHIFRILPCAS